MQLLLHIQGSSKRFNTATVHRCNVQTAPSMHNAEYPWASAIASFATLLTFGMEYALGNIFRNRLGGSGLSPPSSSGTLAVPIQVCVHVNL